jgi:hypothetical protein
MSIAQTPNPEATLPVIAPEAEPMNKAFAQSGQTSRPVTVSSKGALMRRLQSGQSLPDRLMPTSCDRSARRVRPPRQWYDAERSRGRWHRAASAFAAEKVCLDVGAPITPPARTVVPYLKPQRPSERSSPDGHRAGSTRLAL